MVIHSAVSMLVGVVTKISTPTLRAGGDADHAFAQLDLLGEIKKDGAASEDDVDRAKKKAEEIVVEAGRTVDNIISSKEKDILEI